jgi:hypothetical protein
MAITKYGSISPRTASYTVKDMLAKGKESLVMDKFGGLEPLPILWDDVEPEVVDPLYICTGNCRACSVCSLRDYHTYDEMEEVYCANYDGTIVDGMVAEAVDKYPDVPTVKFRRHGIFTADPDGPVELYNDGVKILETHSTGISVQSRTL